MPLKIIRGSHRKIIGRGPVLLACPPSTDKNEELYTGSIVEQIALLSKSHALIEGETKQPQDLQTTEHIVSDFQASMKELLDQFHIKLVLTIVGTEGPGIELVLTQNGVDSDRIIALLKQKLAGFSLRIDETGISHEADITKVQSVQIGLGPDERGFRRDQTTSSMVDLIGQIKVLLGPSESDERASSILD